MQESITNNRPYLLLEKSKHLKRSTSNEKKNKNTSASEPLYKYPKSDARWHYRIKFDVSLQLEEMWVDSQTLDYLNSFRDEIFASQGFPLSAGTIVAAPTA